MRDPTASRGRPGATAMLWLLAFVLAGPPVAAGEDGEGLHHDDYLLPVDASLTLREVLATTAARYPARLELEARSEEAEAWKNRGDSLISGRPSLFYRYQTDRLQDDAGLREMEAGIEVPLWHWGEREATQAVGAGLEAESVAAGAALQWELAGRLRSLLWEMELAANEVAVAEERLAMAERRADAVRRRYELGDVPLGDTLLTDAERADAQTALTEATAAQVESQRAWRMLTTMDRRPPVNPEQRSERAGIGPDHPALRLADQAVETASAEYDRTEKSARGHPTLLVGPRRERAVAGDAYADSIGISGYIPFGGSSHAAPEIAAAGRKLAAARAARAHLERDLRMQLHEAEHSFAVARTNLAAAEERARLTGRSHDMGRIAYEKGEIGLLDLLRLADTALAARRDLARLRILEQRAIADYNQAVGELP